jgi:hypothetical protein
MWVLITVLGVGMAAVQVVPTWRHLNQSVRAGGLSLQYAANSNHSQIKDLSQPFFPYMSDLTHAVTAAAGFYDGALVAVAALFALWGIRRASPPAWCLALSGLLASLISLGSSTPVYGLLWRLPFLSGLRFPLRYQFLASFCFACIGAIGLHRVTEWNRERAPGTTRLRPFLPVTISLLLGAGVVWLLRAARAADLILCLFFLSVSLGLLLALCSARRSLLIALLVGLNLFLLIDLSYFRFHSHYAPSVTIADALRRDGVAGWLHRDRDQFRLLALSAQSGVELNDLRPQDVLQGSSPPLWGLASLGYHSSLQPRRYQRVLQELSARLLSGPDQASKLSHFLGFLQAKYVIAPHGFDLGWEKAAEEGQVTVWRNPDFHSGDYLVGKLERDNVRDETSIAEEICSRMIDFRQTAIITSDQLPELNGLGSRAEVRRLAPQYDGMGFHVTSDRPALLVIPSNYYPGWTATVNGHPAQIYRTNWIGMGILVNAGESIVTMRFCTPGFRTGVGLSLLSLALWIAISLWSPRHSS